MEMTGEDATAVTDETERIDLVTRVKPIVSFLSLASKSSGTWHLMIRILKRAGLGARPGP